MKRLKPYETLRNVTKPYETFETLRNVTKPYETLRNLTKPYETLRLQPATVFVVVQTFVVGGKVCTTTKIVAGCSSKRLHSAEG